MVLEDTCRTLGKALSFYSCLFAEAMTGIEVAPHRTWYAQVLISRLLLIYDLQVAGFLGVGDRWYVHTHLSQSQQVQANRFYQAWFLPLCHQGLGLPHPERPLPLQAAIGQVPYLGGRLFRLHQLEHQYPTIDIPDAPFEAFLGWLAEQHWERTAECPADTPPEPLTITRWTLAGAFEYWHTGRTGTAVVSSPGALQTTCDRTLHACLLSTINHHQEYQGPQAESVEGLFTNLDDQTCGLLVTTVLPTITVLDPACGSGRLLVMALGQLRQWYERCYDQAQRSPDAQLQAWVHSLSGSKPSTAWTQESRILTQHLYGVDIRPEAVEMAQLQLWLSLLATATTVDELAPLPDLEFNITTGNALFGFIRVDEAGFDQVMPKRFLPSNASEVVLQGNLLQPLAAASYRDTLTEKHIRVEHYRRQTKAMAEADGIPDYVQTDFLRDRIHDVNQAAHRKLNRLLLETCSRTFGIQVREPHPSGGTQKRLLTLEDIQSLQPFHWGFFFNGILQQQEGFRVIMTHPPDGTLRPTASEFYTQYAHRFQQQAIPPEGFRRSHQRLLRQYPDLAALWATYAGQVAWLRDYVRRSDDYHWPLLSAMARSLPWKTLFTQRCAALLSPHGVPPYFHEPR